MASDPESYCEVVDVLARTAQVPRVTSFFRALRESPTPFDASVERRGGGWERIDFLLRGRRGVTVEAVRFRTRTFRPRILELMGLARQGSPRRARTRVLAHLGETRTLYRLKICDWLESDDDWYFVYMLGAYLCEHGQALLHNPSEGFVVPGVGPLLKP